MRPFEVQVGLVEPGGFRTNFVRATNFGARAAEKNSGYFERIEAFKQTLKEKQETVNADPMVVARLILRLCERRRIPLHSFVGKDARTLSFLNRLIPHSTREALTRLVFDRFMTKRR